MIKIVIVESDPALAWLLREELEDAGFGVRVCRDLHHAQSTLGAEPADVLISDICGDLGVRWRDSIGRLGKDHQCSVVMLGPKDSPAAEDGGPVILRKSSDLRPLINCLRGQAAKAMWMRSDPANA